MQLLAIPLAIASLGVEGYAIYVALFAIAAWVGLGTVAPGPALVVRMASSKEIDRQSTLFSSAFWPVAVNLLIIAAVALVMMIVFPIEAWLKHDAQMNVLHKGLALFLLVAIAICQGFMKVVESAQAGFQETHLLNIRGLIGNILTIVALILMTQFSTSLTGFVAALFLPQLATRFANAVIFLRRRPHLLPRLKNFDWTESRSLFADGVVYTFATNAGGYLVNQLPLLLLATYFSRTSEAALIAVSLTLLISAFGVVSMLCVPLWPAIADSVLHHDYQWARRAYRRIIQISMGYAFCFSIVLAIGGPKIYEVWLSKKIPADSVFCISMAIYFCLLVWEYTHFMVLVGLGKMRIPPILFLARGVISCLSIYLLALANLEHYSFFALSAATLVVTGIPLPILTRTCIAGIQYENTADSLANKSGEAILVK